MRRLLPIMLLAALFALGPLPALAAKKQARKTPKRVRTHVSLHVTKHHLVRGGHVVLHGRVRPAGQRRVKVVVRGRAGSTAATTSGPGGGFRVRWRSRRAGSHRVSAHVIHNRRHRGAASPSRRITAYRQAHASYYGPGLYGNLLACGGTLQPGTLGVAHKTLPCGSRVRFRYRGRTVTVRVVDRGPYVAGRDFDLTAATRSRLRFPSTGVLLASR
jgi:rare lipoprotein A (peptidoglycan hydrolase)